MEVGRPERLRDFDDLGQRRYFLTFCTDHRRPLFTSEPAVTLVLAQISRAAMEEGFAVIAYCFMRDHLHLLIEGSGPISDCRRFIRKSRQYSAFYYSKEFHERLWQPYGYEHVLRSDEATHAVVRYILENPVRAGIVANVLDYPFCGSLVHRTEDLVDGLPQPYCRAEARPHT